MKMVKANIILFMFILMLFIPVVTNNYTQFIVNMILVYILVTLGFNIILGYVGRFSFANASFLGIGAYVTGLSMVKFNIPFWLCLPLSGLITAIIGLLIGFPALRLHRYYLAIVTIAFTSLMRFTYIHGGDFTFGPSGFNIPNPKLFGWVISTDKQIFYIVLIVFVLLIAFTKTLIQSKVGRAFIAVKESDDAAEALSINSKRTVLFAFSLSGFIVGMAGGLFSLVMGRITPDSFGMHELIRHFIMVVLGGLGSITGSFIGAIIIIILPEIMRFILDYQEFIYGMIIILVVLFAPQGIYGFIINYIPGVSHEKLYTPNIK
jgi:branched-chain amino acid transport system permease protein